jgi:hypothetical protein
MSFVNAGAYVDERRPATKKALRDAVAAGHRVTFDTTSLFTPDTAYLTPDELVVGTSYSVVGPDPYTARKWYATVTRSANGIVVVK